MFFVKNNSFMLFYMYSIKIAISKSIPHIPYAENIILYSQSFQIEILFIWHYIKKNQQIKTCDIILDIN